MKIIRTDRFERSFQKLQKPLKTKAMKKIALFLENLFHPSLHTEKLEPRKKNIWSFRLDRNHRVIFTFPEADTILFLNIGPHDIYRKL